MSSRTITTEELLTLLADAPLRLTAASKGLTNKQLSHKPTPDEWSPAEILAHMRSCEDMWGKSIRIILAENAPTIKAINPTTWINQTDYPQLDFHISLATFVTQRADLVTTLTALAPDDWLRWATVTGAGKPLHLTVKAYAQRLAIHERSHVKQIERLTKSLR